MNQLITPRTLSGFKDRLPNEALIKNHILRTVSDVFMRYGFAPIETPHLEYSEVLIKQGSDEIQKELYRFQDHGDRDVALRFDLTVPLARFVSQHKNDLGIPFKRFAIGNVFRGERAQAGRYREFTQCDFDFIGVDSIAADAEIVQVMADSLKSLGIEHFTIAINNRKIMNGLCDHLNLHGHIEAVLRIVDKRDKIGEEKVRSELKETLNLEDSVIDSILEFISIAQEDDSASFFATVKKYEEYNESMKTGIEELKMLTSILDSLEMSQYKIDFSIARGLGYYTGIVYETTLDEYPQIGSVCSGGRYDNLTQTFSKEPMPGVGASIGIDRLIAALEKLGKIKDKSTPADVLIPMMDAAYVQNVFKLAAELRKEGIHAEIYPKADKMKKQLNYANKKGHPFVIFLGEDEIRENTFTLKCMTSGTQHDKIAMEDVIKIIKCN